MKRLTTAHVAAALALALPLACGQAQDSATSADAPKASALRTTALSDQFNAYDSSTWEMANWANGNPFNCGFLPDHVTFSGGSMTLKLDNVASSGKSYSGGEYRTKDTFSYGKFETRMKAAKASGIVSSFFTYTGSPWDEIDVEILGKNTTQAQFNYYVNGTGGHEKLVDLGFDASAGYHTYTIDWQPNSISWYVDGVLKHSVTGGTLPSHPMQIMMNLWNGIGVDSWLGSFSYGGALYASYDYVTYTPPGSTVTTYNLGVSKSGTGSGTVTSSPSGIDCGNACSASFNSGTSVTLTPSAASGSTFAGWSGACTGSGTCIVTMTAAQSVTASFSGPVQTGGSVSLSAGGSASGSFSADAYYSGGNTYSTTKTIDTSALSGSVPPQAVLQSERYGEFTYTIPGLTAGAAYAVTLYFVESYWTAAGQRKFNVAINGNTVLSAFDIYATAGGANKAIARSFSATANGSGQVVIAFTKGGGPDNPKVVALTVVPGDPGSSSGGTSSGGTSSGGTSSGGTSSGGTSSGGTSSGGTSSGGTSSGGTSSGGTTCKAISGGQSGNFNTTGEICFTVSTNINGWGCSNVDGRTVTVNGTATTCGKLPLPGSAPYTFSFTGGSYPWASFYWW